MTKRINDKNIGWQKKFKVDMINPVNSDIIFEEDKLARLEPSGE